MKLHPQFRLNGTHLNGEHLRQTAYSWVKEGEDFERSVGNFILDWMDPSPTIEVNTSGSTGLPKTISLLKTHMINSARATGDYFGLKPGDSALLCLSSNFIAGKMMLVRAMVLGLEIDIAAPTSNPLVSTAKKYKFTAMVPLQAQNSLPKLHQVDQLIIGGAPISRSLRKSLEKLPSRIYETYGMTETITHIAVRRISELGTKTTKFNFQTLSGVGIKKDDRGCLVIEAPNVSNTIIITNDLVELIDGNHFKWLGRYDNIVNSGGVKLIPERIEEKLSSVIPQRFFVAGVPDAALGQKLVLLVEGVLDSGPLSDKISALKVLTRFEVPKELICVDQFFETVSGKVDRQKTLSATL